MDQATHEYHVFISYNKNDGDKATGLASALKDFGVKPFCAQENIELGADWERRIHKALIESSIVLSLISANSRDSAWVHAEAGAAWALNKPLVPAFYGVDPGDMIEIYRTPQGKQMGSKEQLDIFLRHFVEKVRRESPLKLLPTKAERAMSKPTEESFTLASDWEGLLKAGEWLLEDGAFTGRGMYNYLVTDRHYTPPFSVTAELTFEDLHAKNKSEAVNAGLIFGLQTSETAVRYFNMLLNEERMFLELVGGRGGDQYSDFEHFGAPSPFPMKQGEPYEMKMVVEPGEVRLRITDTRANLYTYDAKMPEIASGKVGLRPWRSRVKGQRFVVRQL